MNVDRFERMIATYGADPGRWPESLRADALALVDASADARAAWERARHLDSLFATDRPAIDPARAEAILAGALGRIRVERVAARRPEPGWRFLFAPLPSAAFATMLAAGVALGFAIYAPAPPQAAQDGLASLLDVQGTGVEGLIQ